MSAEIVDIKKAITSFNNDIENFFELLNKLDYFKDKIQAHITEFRKSEELKSFADIANEDLSFEWTALIKSKNLVEAKLKDLHKQTISKQNKEKNLNHSQVITEKISEKEKVNLQNNEKEEETVNNIQIDKEKEELKKKKVKTKKCPEKLNEIVESDSSSETAANKKSCETKKSPENLNQTVESDSSSETAADNQVENNNQVNEDEDSSSEALNTEKNTQIESCESVEKEIDTLVNNSKKCNTEKNTNSELGKDSIDGSPVPHIEKSPEPEVKIESSQELNISLPKPGTIRVVPLQSLLSPPERRSRNSPNFQWVFDNEDKTTPLSKNNSKPQIFELSDSDDEKPLQKKSANTQDTKLGPRKKFTPLRNSSDIIKTKEKEKENCNSVNSEISKKGLESKTHPVKADTNSSSVRRCSINSVSQDSSALLRNFLQCGDKESNEIPPSSTASTLFPQFSQRKCVVRIKRIPLTANNIKTLDRYKNSETRKTSKSCKSQIKLKSKTMASGSDSEVDTPQNIENGDSEESSSSEIEIIPQRKMRVFKKKDDSDSDYETNSRKNTSVRKKRKIVKNSSNSSDGSDAAGDNKQRKKIRKVINEKHLDQGTKRATKEEEERKKRIEERQKVYNQIYVKPENVEVDELILDFDETTKKPLLKVDDGLMKKLKPHQVKGVKFMWDACFETIKDCKEKPGSGCILAHCMGLGKTMQIVTLSHTLLSNFESTNIERVLIISPLSTLNNWAREFNYWISFAKNKDIEIYDLSKYKDKNTRVFKLNEWFTDGGVCIVGYDMYRILSNPKTKGLRKKQKDSLQMSLVDPGPDVVVCDEGHLLKNEKTSLSQAVTKMRTKRRIVLTGTPLQNNLKEYYCMIQFIKPNLLGTYKEYLNRFVNPISNGQYTDSTPRDIRLMKHRSHILHKMLEACIQRRDYSVLAPYLPPKHEYVVFCTLSEKQKLIYEHYMTKQRDAFSEASGNPGKGAKLFQDFQNLRRIWTHPMNMRVNSDTVIKKKLAQYDSEDSLKDFVVEDSEQSTSSESESSACLVDADTKPRTFGITRATRNLSDNDDCLEVPVKDDPSEWWTQFVEDIDLNNIHHSPKLVLLMTLLQKCEEIGDKVLVFSQSLQSLDVIEHFLSLIDRKTRGEEIEGDVGDFKGFWRPSVNYFRLDGSRTVENRESMCKSFNNITNLNVRLFLISTRAGGLGINLVAANRVVIFDVSWNPSHDTQSIFRVYRFGQIKPCYIYRLIALGTMEQKVYERQVAKQATAKRVIDEQQISRHYNQSDLQELYTYELEPSTAREIPILPKDRLFAELLCNHEKLVFKYHEHDSLLENEDSENLTEEERKAAWDEYEAEKTRPPQPTMQYLQYDRQQFLANYGNPQGTVTSNKIFGFRSDILLRLLNMKSSQEHPELNQTQAMQLVPEYLQRLYLEMNNGDPTLYKDLLELHKSLEAPGGMYMSPLLFANQTPAPPPGMHPYGTPYGQMHPSTSSFNSNEVYEVD